MGIDVRGAQCEVGLCQTKERGGEGHVNLPKEEWFCLSPVARSESVGTQKMTVLFIVHTAYVPSKLNLFSPLNVSETNWHAVI